MIIVVPAKDEAAIASVAADRDEILARHRDWWIANDGLDIPMMQKAFPTGDAYLQFNLNGHPYFGIKEKTELWEWYIKNLGLGLSDVVVMKFIIDGDTAWIASELTIPLKATGPAGTGSDSWVLEDPDEWTSYRARVTEIYHKDDGDGNPAWRMWHYHASPLPPEDETRPAFSDTPAERGIGGTPWGPPVHTIPQKD